MKLVILFSICFAVAYCSTIHQRKRPRRYFPEENDPYRIKTLILQDNDGKLHFEDLTAPQLREEAATEDDVTFYFYSQTSPNSAEEIKATNFSTVYETKFKPEKKTKFIIHGWNNHKDSDCNVLTKEAIFSRHDYNVFVVDWNKPAHKFYTTSKKAVPIVGELVGHFINFLINNYGMNPKDFSIVGFSLGAHAAGHAGTVVKEKYDVIDYIVGLDPASPLFTVEDIHTRLDTTDAHFVHVIHTNGAFLGFKSSIGHADYYPNGGMKQVGCGFDIVGICSHKRSVEYYAESILSSGFTSHLCDDITRYDDGDCHANEDSWMGEAHIDRRADGDYFLRTAEKHPFALG